MDLAFVPLHDFSLARSAEVLNHGFTNYFVPIQLSPAALVGMARNDSVDLTVSRIAMHDGVPLGAALIARRGWTCRLASMAITPEARGRGVGRAVLAHVIAEAQTRGDRTMVLEVIEQNEPAVRLYEKAGFQRVRRLVGFAGQPPARGADEAAAPEEIDGRAFARIVAEHGLPDLPWQLSAETLAHATPPARAFRLGPAAALLTDPAAETISIRGLVTESASRGRGHALALLHALQARYPGKTWRASAIFPEEMSRCFRDAGLERTALSQWQMTLPLA